MVKLFVVVSLLLAGCGLGFGAVNGPSREYSWSHFHPDRYFEKGGAEWAEGTIFTSHAEPSYGLLLGTRRGWSWNHFGGNITDGDNSDYHFTGYLGALALAVGYTTDSGNVAIPYATSTLASTAGYHGWYLEPTATVLSLGPLLYVGVGCALINGTATAQFPNHSAADEADAVGVRPVVRIALPGLPVGPVTLQLTAELRYLFSAEVTFAGSGLAPMSYGGLSSAFALNFVL
jgi:hypothetical protein